MSPLACHVCGARFRTHAAEARHRHNFPLLCNQRSASFRAWREEREREAAAVAVEKREK